jgi:very-short-patch-repair endonuclease
LTETSKYFKENNPMHIPEIVEKVASTHRGRAKSEDHKRKLSEAQIGERNHSWGKKRPEHSALLKEIMPAIMKQKYQSGELKPTFLGRHHTEESRKKMSLAHKGKIKWPNGNPNKGKKLSLTIEQIANRSAKRVAWLLRNDTNKVGTTIELIFKSWCDENSIEYQHQFPLSYNNGSWLFDFYLPQLNMLVEIDGEYWHSKPQQVARDRLKEKTAKQANFLFCRISDSNLNCSIVLESHDAIEKHNFKIIEHRRLKNS